MNIPMDYFSSVPVVLLSPSIMCTPEEEIKESLTKSLVNKITSDSEQVLKDNSPDYSRPGSSMDTSVISEPGNIGRFRSRTPTGSKYCNCYTLF